MRGSIARLLYPLNNLVLDVRFSRRLKNQRNVKPSIIFDDEEAVIHFGVQWRAPVTIE